MLLQARRPYAHPHTKQHSDLTKNQSSFVLVSPSFVGTFRQVLPHLPHVFPRPTTPNLVGVSGRYSRPCSVRSPSGRNPTDKPDLCFSLCVRSPGRTHVLEGDALPGDEV